MGGVVIGAPARDQGDGVHVARLLNRCHPLGYITALHAGFDLSDGPVIDLCGDFEKLTVFRCGLTQKIGPPYFPEIEPISQGDFRHHHVACLDGPVGGVEIRVISFRFLHGGGAYMGKGILAAKTTCHTFYDLSEVRVPHARFGRQKNLLMGKVSQHPRLFHEFYFLITFDNAQMLIPFRDGLKTGFWKGLGQILVMFHRNGAGPPAGEWPHNAQVALLDPQFREPFRNGRGEIESPCPDIIDHGTVLGIWDVEGKTQDKGGLLSQRNHHIAMYHGRIV